MRITKGILGTGLVSCFIGWVFLSICFGQEVAAQSPKEQVKDIFEVKIPGSWGRVKEIYKGTSEIIIVHIQDAHRNYDAQMSISKILNRLVREYGIKVAGIEAASSKLHTEVYSTIPDEEIRAQVADFFVREGTFNGSEALVIREGFEYPLELYGIEDKNLYDNNFKAFQTSLPFKKEVNAHLENLSASLEQLKSPIYTADLLAFDAKQTAFEDKTTGLNEYCLFLLEKTKVLEQDAESKYKNFYNLIKAIGVEETLDFTKAEEERTALLTELTNILNEEDIQALLDEGLAYRNEEISASAYLVFVKKLGEKNNIDFGKYQNLTRYIDYSLNYEKITGAELFDELAQIEERIRESLYTDDLQRQLDLYVKAVKVMDRLVGIKMVNKDLSFYDKNKEKLTTDSIAGFIKTQAQRFSLALKLPGEISYLDVYIPAWVDFYRVAGQRDEAMITNSLNLLKEKKQKVIALVCGGFHTNELTRIMRAKGISYLVITPQITTNEGNRYFEILQGGKTKLDEFAEGFITP